MIQPIRHETPFARPRGRLAQIPDPRVRLHTLVSLPVYVETVLCRQRERAGHHRAVALTGKLHLPELHAEIALCSHDAHRNGSGYGEEHRATAAIVPHRFAMPIPPQHFALPPREESDVWASTPAPDRDPPWMEHYAGQLDGEPLTFDRYVPVDVTLDVTFTTDECQDGGGANLNVAGELRFERSMHMRLRFRDRGRSSAPPSASDTDEAVLIVAGSLIRIPRQTVAHLAGPTLMTVRVIEADGRAVRVEQTLIVPAGSAA